MEPAMPRHLCKYLWVGVAIGVFVRAQVGKPGYCLYCLIVNMDCSWTVMENDYKVWNFYNFLAQIINCNVKLMIHCALNYC